LKKKSRNPHNPRFSRERELDMTDNIIREIRVIRENPRFRRYPEYKESGVEWIGEIPAHWEINRLKYVAKILPSNVDKHIYPDEIQVRLCNYTDVYYNDYITVDTVLKKGSCKESEFTKFVLRKGNVIITKDSETPDDIGVPTFVKDDLNNVVCGYHLTMIRPLVCRGEFIFRFIQSDRMRKYFELESNGVTRYGLGKSSIENLLLPIPTDSEQRQIANFLDRKTEQIDELIRIKERRIELLQEQRIALINQAVTKGLDPNVEIKPSGVEWIGEIPAHWKVLRTKHVGSSNPSKNNTKTACLKDELVVFLPMERVHADGTIDQELRLPYSQMKNGYTYFEEGDILIAKVTPCFENGKIVHIKNLATSVGFGSTEFIVMRPDLQKVFPPFLHYIFYNAPLRSIGKHFMTSAIGLKRVPTEFVENFRIPIPTYQEQTQIASFLDRKTQQIDDLIAAEHRKIQLLQEYRQSLISEAVTGKIDVRSKV